MKRIFAILLCLIMAAAAGLPVALAESSATPAPTGSPSSSATPAPTGSPPSSATPAPTASSIEVSPLDAIIGYKSKGCLVLSVQLRLLSLGYYNYKVTGKYAAYTRKAIMAFQLANGLPQDGYIGSQSAKVLYSNDVIRMLPVDRVIKGPDIKRTSTEFGIKGDWSTEIDALMPINTTLTIIDFNTLAEFKMVRTGGKNHADVEPVTNKDNVAYVNSFGGIASWEKRPVLVKLNNKLYAASLFGWPHGTDTISDNGMQGHTDLYFTGSLSDVSNLPDAEHEAKITRATGGQ